MLTVAREAGAAALARAARPRADARAVAHAAVSGARLALQRTPDLLPALRDAGVVDAGGQGLVVVLEALAAALDDRDVATITLHISGAPRGGQGLVSEAYLQQVESEQYGFCTQFLIRGDALDVDTIRTSLAAMAQSAVVVGDRSLVKVHVHAVEPRGVLSYAERLGAVSDVHLENIDAMHKEFAEGQRKARPQVAVAVVAVAWGAGFARVFTDLGVCVVESGRTMNPSTQELLTAAENSGGEAVIILPNNPNVAGAARQAAEAAKNRNIHVVPTRTLPQGVAAALVWSPERDMAHNVEAMAEALASVNTIEVARAARDAVVDGRPVRSGEFMGVVDDRLATVAPSVVEALKGAIVAARSASGSLVTLYWGGALTQDDVSLLTSNLREQLPAIEIQAVFGGQPYYDVIASVE
jgi:DAK2 domain fusion protein YloV